MCFSLPLLQPFHYLRHARASPAASPPLNQRCNFFNGRWGLAPSSVRSRGSLIGILACSRALAGIAKSALCICLITLQPICGVSIFFRFIITASGRDFIGGSGNLIKLVFNVITNLFFNETSAPARGFNYSWGSARLV